MAKYDYETVKQRFGSSIISDVLDSFGYRNQMITYPICPLNDETFIYGPAFTSIGTQVYTMPTDPLTAQCKVVDQLSEGEIYILTIRGEKNCAVFGELFATAVKNRNGGGVLLDGFARDMTQIKEMNFPLFYAGINPKTSKGRCEINECQIPIIIQGVTINPGDIILGDIDGVAVIPSEISDRVMDEAFLVINKETIVREGLKNGASLQEMYSQNGAI